MLEKLGCFSWALSSQGDADSIAHVFLPSNVGFTVIGVGFAGSSSGTVSAANVDVQDDTVDLAGCVALDITTVAGDYGAATQTSDCHAAAGSLLTLDLNITGGGNITGTITLYGFWDEA